MRTLITTHVLLMSRTLVENKEWEQGMETYTHTIQTSLSAGQRVLPVVAELSLHCWSLLNLDQSWPTSGSQFTCIDQVSIPPSPPLPLSPTQDLAFAQSPEGAALANPPPPLLRCWDLLGRPFFGGWEAACPSFQLFLFRQIPSLHSESSY